MKYILSLFLFVIYSTAHGQIITTIAGNDTFGFRGDGGPATAAEFKFPSQARPDGSGNVYITDVSNNRVRKVSVAGIITTIAGGVGTAVSGSGVPATAAELDGPISVVTDTAGNIYFSETTSGYGSGSACVMKIDTAGIMIIFAGGGSGGPGSGDGGPATVAEFRNISDIAFDKTGNMYILDPGMNNLRKVDTAGIITTIAGNGTPGYSGDGGPATAAQLYQPDGVAVDNTGNIYIADTHNQRIRKVDAAGIITTIAGDSTYGYSGDGGPATAARIRNPTGVAADSAGNVYFSDSYNGRIRKISGGIITTIAGDSTYGHSGDGGPATAAELGPWSVTLDRAGNIYVAENDLNDVRKITAPPRVTEGVAPPGLPRGEEVLTVYPNPNEGSYTIRVSSAASEAVQVVISNVMGQKVKGITTVTNKDIEVQTDSPPGIYFITAVTASGMESGKVMVR